MQLHSVVIRVKHFTWVKSSCFHGRENVKKGKSLKFLCGFESSKAFLRLEKLLHGLGKQLFGLKKWKCYMELKCLFATLCRNVCCNMWRDLRTWHLSNWTYKPCIIYCCNFRYEYMLRLSYCYMLAWVL